MNDFWLYWDFLLKYKLMHLQKSYFTILQQKFSMKLCSSPYTFTDPNILYLENQTSHINFPLGAKNFPSLENLEQPTGDFPETHYSPALSAQASGSGRQLAKAEIKPK